ncbi:MAG: glycogen/starch synthase [Lachnospiraceae bacterium]|nr:glycogen/starch synthase [Lachnospiraceae bacterium]
MKILFATSECAPFSKSGGLADVAYSLPPALKKSGNDIAVITPYYKCVKDKYADQVTFVLSKEVAVGDNVGYCGLYEGVFNGVTTWFVDNESLFYRDKLYGYNDDAFRFAFFSRCVIELLSDISFMPDIIHCNDWETAPVIIYLKNDQTWKTGLQGIKTVYTIHNIAYQGQFGAEELERTFGLPGGWYEGGLGYEYEGRNDINLMKGAMLMADAVSTVSPTYARELHLPQYGMGLQGVADLVGNKMYGILNGIDMDLYNPKIDTRIVANFDVKDMAGKKACKAHIQELFGLRVDATTPVLSSVARLNEQKGIELIKQVLPGIMDLGAQLIVFGQGEQEYVDFFNEAKKRWPGQLGFSSDYTENVAAQIFAGADMYLMPSRFEPCGLSQMMAMRYGTVPIVHATGGLKDSIRGYREFDGIGDGFTFSNYDGRALYQAVLFALKIYFGDETAYKTIVQRCMTKNLSWDKSADQYIKMYNDISDGGSGEELSFEEAFKTLKEEYIKHDVRVRRNKANKELRTEDYKLTVQMHIKGRGEGVFYMQFFANDIVIEPYTYAGADVRISASYDNFYGMIVGNLPAHKLFMNGQLKIRGNLTKIVDLKILLGV